MIAIDNTELAKDLHYGPDSVGFQPVVTFAVTNNTTTKQVVVSQASVFASGDAFKKVLINVYDVDGLKKSGVINAAADSATISIAELNASGISITATVISTAGNKADLGVYKLDGKTGSGALKHLAKQGVRG